MQTPNTAWGQVHLAVRSALPASPLSSCDTVRCPPLPYRSVYIVTLWLRYSGATDSTLAEDNATNCLECGRVCVCLGGGGGSVNKNKSKACQSP